MSSDTDPIRTSSGTSIRIKQTGKSSLEPVTFIATGSAFELHDWLTLDQARSLAARLIAVAEFAERHDGQCKGCVVRPSAEVQMQQGIGDSLAQASLVAGLYDESRELPSVEVQS